jgi:hypothetical protein
LKKQELKNLISSIINADDLTTYLLKHDLSTHNKTDSYELIIESMCHTSCEWATRLLNKNLNKDVLKNLYWCVGDYTHEYDNLLMVAEHSWIEYRNKSKIIIIDLTISQFDNSLDKLHIEYKNSNYSTANFYVNCNSIFHLNKFTKTICMV